MPIARFLLEGIAAMDHKLAESRLTFYAIPLPISLVGILPNQTKKFAQKVKFR